MTICKAWDLGFETSQVLPWPRCCFWNGGRAHRKTDLKLTIDSLPLGVQGTTNLSHSKGVYLSEQGVVEIGSHPIVQIVLKLCSYSSGWPRTHDDSLASAS